MAIRTIFNTVEDCSRGMYQGWHEFVRDYAPIARKLLSHYFPALKPNVDAGVADVFTRARQNDNSWFRSLRFDNEREFAMSFRELVLASGRSGARRTSLNLSPDQVFTSLAGLTLVQREFFWTFLKGWDVQQASAMLMNASATSEATSQIVDERLAQLGPATERMNIALLATEAAQSRRQSDCLPWKAFNNVINGQISWSEREACERHIQKCARCLDGFTAFQEMIWLQKVALPLADTEAEALVAKLGVRRATKLLRDRILPRAS